MPENKHDNGKRYGRELPPKSTAERVLLAAGLWSDMGREEIDRIKRDIFSSRRSSTIPPKLTTNN